MSDREAPDRADGPGRPTAADVRTLPVQRIRPGQHAFAAYDSESTQWDVVSAFVRQGLALSEKVLLFLHPGVSHSEVRSRLEPVTPALGRAWDRGQLTLSSMRALISPDRDFTVTRQWRRLAEESEVALRQGYSAMRAYIDMVWVTDLGTDVGAVLQRERSSDHLFAGRRYSEVCAYDDRAFSAEVLDAMHEAHPVNLLGTVGALRAVHATDGPGASDASDSPGGPGGPGGPGTAVRLVGEADIATHDDFTAALRAAFARAEPAHPLRVDLSSLHFLGASCAAELLRLSAAAGTGADGGPRRRTAVHCTSVQARTLRRLGSDAVRSLTLVEEGNGC